MDGASADLDSSFESSTKGESFPVASRKQRSHVDQAARRGPVHVSIEPVWSQLLMNLPSVSPAQAKGDIIVTLQVASRPRYPAQQKAHRGPDRLRNTLRSGF